MQMKNSERGVCSPLLAGVVTYGKLLGPNSIDKLFQRKKVGTHEPPLCSANFQLFVMHHFLLFFQLPHTLLKMQNYILRVKQIHNSYFD